MVLKKAYRKIKNIFNPIVGEVWCLHRVLPNRSVFQRNRELEITPAFLEKLILDYQKHNYSFVSIDELISQLGKRTLGNKKRVNISFDDGFKDVFSNAYPIFRKYQIPFTIYLTSDFPDKRVNLWWITLEHIILNNDKLVLIDGHVLICKNKQEKQVAYETIITDIYKSELPTVVAFETMIGNRYEVDTFQISQQVLTWEELQEMVDSGLCTIGSHTVTHPNLTRLASEQIEKELSLSKQYIANRLQCEVNHFSYPHSFQDDAVIESVKTAGYITASLGYGGSIRRGDNLFLLKRNYIVQK